MYNIPVTNLLTFGVFSWKSAMGARTDFSPPPLSAHTFLAFCFTFGFYFLFGVILENMLAVTYFLSLSQKRVGM